MPGSPCVPSTADHPQRPRSHQHVLSEVPKCASHARSCEIYWEELKVALNPRLRIFLSFSLLLIISSCRGQCALFSPHVQPGSHLSTPHICLFIASVHPFYSRVHYRAAFDSSLRCCNPTPCLIFLLLSQ